MNKHTIRRGLLRLGYDVRRVHMDDGEFGRDPLVDMRRFVSSPRPVVFDVGANVGQTIQKFHTYFKNADIHSFEPGEEAFRKLKEKTHGLNGVHIVNTGMGARREEKIFIENTSLDMSSFLELGDEGWGSVTNRRMVELDTVDDYCACNGIDHIDILKSDTQGYDLEVLRGASKTLREKRIGLIYFEILFSDMYQGCPRFDEVYAFLIDNGMTLVSFYDMHYRNSRLAWTDALFRVY